MKVLLTGSSGFLGSAIESSLVGDSRYRLVTASRAETISADPGTAAVIVGDLNAATDWGVALNGVEVIIHTAARVHIMGDSTIDSLTLFRKVNVEASLNFARQAAAVGVKRFIFISSIKVNGESTLPGKPFTEEDEPDPVGPYAVSKWEAEIGIRRIAEESGMEVVIIRPPLIYGPGVKANFDQMIRSINRGIPLPFGSICNKRSLVGLDNLVDLIVTCIEHPNASNQTFLAGDGEDLSVAELLQSIGKALGRRARLFPFPSQFLTFIASLLGRKEVVQRLCGSLQVDISKAQELLGWEPPVTVEEGLRRAAEDFINDLPTKSQDR